MADVAYQIKEIADRTRRIETRLTGYLEAQGHNTSIRRPTWLLGSVIVPSLQASLQEILSVIPKDYVGTVAIIHHGVRLAWISVG